jgi:hypothetical protein
VYITNHATSSKESGGTIYGSDAGDTLKNTAGDDSSGHAVYVEAFGGSLGTPSSPTKRRNTTAGEGVALNPRLTGAAGGWE